MHSGKNRLRAAALAGVCMTVCGAAGAQDLAVRWANDPGMQRWADTYQPVYGVDWTNGVGSPMVMQANPGDVSVVDDPGRPGHKAVRIAISRDEDFSKVANGAPRGELQFPEPVRFAQGNAYLVRWSTWLPADFAFDSKQLMIVMQIHQTALNGPPTLALTLLGNRYDFSTRGGSNPAAVSAAVALCCADTDRGKWVNWTLHYRPDESGQHALTELYKDGVSVFANRDAPNAYAGDQTAYLKIGMYKPGWLIHPSDVAQSTLFYGPVHVEQR